jgi:cytochrome oxidase Cu insertion factor (SCO1/SenC/PrrC family)
MQNRKKIPRQLISLTLISLFPLIVGGLLFHYHAYFQFKTVNHGILVNPPIQVGYLYSGVKIEDQKKWRMIQVSNKDCDNQCKKLNYLLHQVQKALGKDRDRVDVILVNSQDTQLIKLKNEFAQHDKTFSIENKIYLVDPIGNLFMYYPKGSDPMNVLKDLKRVLEVSQIG